MLNFLTARPVKSWIKGDAKLRVKFVMSGQVQTSTMVKIEHWQNDWAKKNNV
jgi:hypothetical protein